MKINFSANVSYGAKNINFKAFTKQSEKVIRKDISKYDDPAPMKATEELIAQENKRKDRTIKISSHRVVDHSYIPIGFRRVTIVNNLTHDKYKTDICCNLPDCYQKLIDEIRFKKFNL